jgi:hypothetical protein
MPVEPALGGAGAVVAGAGLPVVGAGFEGVVPGDVVWAVAVATPAASSAAKIIVRSRFMSVFSYCGSRGLVCAQRFAHARERRVYVPRCKKRALLQHGPSP